jgi:hypothetical protein
VGGAIKRVTDARWQSARPRRFSHPPGTVRMVASRRLHGGAREHEQVGHLPALQRQLVYALPARSTTELMPALGAAARRMTTDNSGSDRRHAPGSTLT